MCWWDSSYRPRGKSSWIFVFLRFWHGALGSQQHFLLCTLIFQISTHPWIREWNPSMISEPHRDVATHVSPIRHKSAFCAASRAAAAAQSGRFSGQPICFGGKSLRSVPRAGKSLITSKENRPCEKLTAGCCLFDAPSALDLWTCGGSRMEIGRPSCCCWAGLWRLCDCPPLHTPHTHTHTQTHTHTTHKRTQSSVRQSQITNHTTAKTALFGQPIYTMRHTPRCELRC